MSSTETCDVCGGLVDLREPHVKVVRQVEQENRSEVDVISSHVVAVVHVEHLVASPALVEEVARDA